MKERGIIFSAPMVRAILAGRKSQTRRIVKPQPLAHHGITKCWGTSPDGFEFGEKYVWTESGPDYPDGPEDERRSPYGVPGERLWVRETWAPVERAEDHVDGIRYRADESFSPIENTREAADRWVEAARTGASGCTRSRPTMRSPKGCAFTTTGDGGEERRTRSRGFLGACPRRATRTRTFGTPCTRSGTLGARTRGCGR